MSRRHDLKRRLATLSEIDEIMQSMRMLSLLETRKLARFIACQRRVVELQKLAAADFLHFFPPRINVNRSPQHVVIIVVGSERGFCGDFNSALRDELVVQLERASAASHTVIAVGRKLSADLEADDRSVSLIDGPSTAEEVPAVLQRLVAHIEDIVDRGAASQLSVVHHGGTSGEIVCSRIIPAFDDLPAAPAAACPPMLYLDPETLLAGLVDQYLFAALHDIFFTSLLIEHQRRVQHLDGATQRLEQTVDELSRRNNTLRQEEITEELQVILLGADLV
jgi:F-type H+-transporting ATPase subunit gamma